MTPIVAMMALSFAAIALMWRTAFDYAPARLNPRGGAIAIGHPLGASGARITTHIVYELARRSGRYAVGSACIGGGQGIAVVIERV